MSTATILDVARQAQVSSGTVSRALRGHPSVSADNLQRVLQAVEALNYSPRRRNAAMSDINPLERKNVLMLMLGDERSITALPVVASVVQGVQRAIEAAQADLTIAEVPGADHVPKVMTRKSFSGVIVKGGFASYKGGLADHLAKTFHPELLASLRSIPTVWVLGRGGDWGDVVQSNDVLIGTIAAEYLIARGHRQLAFLDPRPTQVMIDLGEGGRAQDAGRYSAGRRRQASFTFFAQEAGATVKAYRGDPGSWPFPSPVVDRIDMVQGLVDKLLGEHEPPTAIFTPIDSVGATVARALASRGLQAGRDISLISCNNEQPLFMGIHPALTTIDVHAGEIGRRAVDQLAWRLRHRNEPFCEVAIEPTLIEGASVATLQANQPRRRK